jgi:hypothetical protein
MGKGFTHMASCEIALAQRLRQQGQSLGSIAEALGRSKEAVRENTTPALIKKKGMKAKGRPRLITEKKFEVIMALVEHMVKEADCRWEVTLDMVKRRAQFKGSLRTLSNTIHSHGVYFRRFREKLLLTAQDVVDRKAFASKFSARSPTNRQRPPLNLDRGVAEPEGRMERQFRGANSMSMVEHDDFYTRMVEGPTV